MTTLAGGPTGKLYSKSQVTDYQCRGEGLQGFNLIEFTMHSYERERSEAVNGDEPHEVEGQQETHNQQGGRPRNDRVEYTVDHPKHSTLVRILRTVGHNNLPNFIGGHTIPRSDDPEIVEFYSACMLTLLKPWRDITTDLKGPNETWAAAFNAFQAGCDEYVQRIISGFQYFHECETAAKENREARSRRPRSTDEEEVLGEDTGHEPVGQVPSTELLESLRSQDRSEEEAQNGRKAVWEAKMVGIFSEGRETHEGDGQGALTDQGISHATAQTTQQLEAWREQMQADIAQQSTDHVLVLNNASQPDVQMTLGDDGASVTLREQLECEEALESAQVSELKVDQRRAYDIIAWHLNQTINEKAPPPLRLIISGEGGTGKSKVIQTVTARFKDKQSSQMLAKGAYTGIAASLINGKTTHTLGAISQRKTPMSPEAKAKLQLFFKHVRYLIIDEYSMLGKAFFAKLSRNISIAKQEAGQAASSESFGGISVILCGDHHQFPPVMGGEHEALYWPANPAHDSTEAQLGRAIFAEFRETVILREQMRVTDLVWRQFLRNLRFGRVRQEDLTMLRRQIVSHPDCIETDFKSEPWSSAGLVTPRHGVREKWNGQAIAEHCRRSRVRRYIVRADDTISNRGKRRELTLEEQIEVQRRRLKSGREDKRNSLPDVVEIAIGMKVMVTTNVETDLDIANGARGTVVGVVLHQGETGVASGDTVTLQHMPAYILVRLDRTRAGRLSGLDEHVIPIEPVTRAFEIRVKTGAKTTTRKVIRRQFPMTAAYAFTDYRSQGQTIPYVIVDIGRVPRGKLSLFNLYVALSRSAGRETIRLLRDFDDAMFLQAHKPPILDEDDRLEAMDVATRRWWDTVTEEVEARSGSDPQTSTSMTLEH